MKREPNIFEIGLSNELNHLNNKMDEAYDFYRRNKENIHCSVVEAVELYIMGFNPVAVCARNK